MPPLVWPCPICTSPNPIPHRCPQQAGALNPSILPRTGMDEINAMRVENERLRTRVAELELIAARVMGAMDEINQVNRDMRELNRKYVSLLEGVKRE